MSAVSEHLARMIAVNRLPHGLLLMGADGSGKREAATGVARMLFCSAAKKPCGECLACKKVIAGTHPDVQFVQAEAREIKIEQIRDFQRWLSIYPHEAPKKVGVIAEADGLNASAANALLKTLEEPPPHAVIILMVRGTNNVLRTIRSRLMLVRFPSPQAEPLAGQAAPAWMEELHALLDQKLPVPPDAIFDFTETAAKNREDLPWVFEAVEKKLLEELKRDPHNRKAERLFDLAIATERETVQRYGNAALALDHLLLEWLT